MFQDELKIICTMVHQPWLSGQESWLKMLKHLTAFAVADSVGPSPMRTIKNLHTLLRSYSTLLDLIVVIIFMKEV